MNKKNLYLTPNSSPTDLLKFMLSTYDGLFVIAATASYTLWGIGGSIGLVQRSWVGNWAILLLPIIMLLTFIGHRRNTYSHDKFAAFYCLVSEFAMAGIPFYKDIKDML